MFFSTLTGFTQDIEFSFSAKTGNAEFDLTLENLNIEAKADLDSLKAEMSKVMKFLNLKLTTYLRL